MKSLPKSSLDDNKSSNEYMQVNRAGKSFEKSSHYFSIRYSKIRWSVSHMIFACINLILCVIKSTNYLL